jgi:hypothetical protein
MSTHKMCHPQKLIYRLYLELLFDWKTKFSATHLKYSGKNQCNYLMEQKIAHNVVPGGGR